MKTTTAVQTNFSETEEASLNIAWRKANNVDKDGNHAPKLNPLPRPRISKKKTKTVYSQLVPSKVMQGLPAIEEEIKPFIKGYKREHLLQIISILAWHLRKNEDYAKLHMGFLKDQVPQGDKYMKGLRNYGIINRTGHPIKGEQCYKYSFAPKWQSKYVSVPLKVMSLIRRLEKKFAEVEKEQNLSCWGHTKQRKFLKQITIDQGFDQFMATEFKGNTRQENLIRASVSRLNNGVYTCRRDKTSQRLHSNITNMSKDLRRYLRVNGRPLKNIDIKNSQPYLSTLLLRHPEQVAQFAQDEALKSLLMEIKIPKSKDIELYIELVTSGTIYEYLMDEFSKEGLILDPDPKKFRNATKRQVLRTLYAKNWMPKNPDNRRAREIFVARFPKVHEVFSKFRGHAKGEKNKTYRRFARLLQRIESYLVLDVIMKRVYKELPGVFVMTIHDSILTIDDTQVVQKIFGIMEEELKNFVGYPPRLKIE